MRRDIYERQRPNRPTYGSDLLDLAADDSKLGSSPKNIVRPDADHSMYMPQLYSFCSLLTLRFSIPKHGRTFLEPLFQNNGITSRTIQSFSLAIPQTLLKLIKQTHLVYHQMASHNTPIQSKEARLPLHHLPLEAQLCRST